MRHYFDGKTNVNIKSDLIGFSIKSLFGKASNEKNTILFNILKYSWSLCLDRTKDTVFVFDEVHIAIDRDNLMATQYLAQIQRRARKYNTGTMFLTQTPSDFADPEIINYGKAIFSNASTFFINGLTKSASEDLAQLINMNDEEITTIQKYGRGESLLVTGNDRRQIEVVLTDNELTSFGKVGGR